MSREGDGAGFGADGDRAGGGSAGRGVDWGDGSGGAGSGGGRSAELDREFERALEEFDGVILSEQEALARAGGGGGAADAASRTGAGAGEGDGSGTAGEGRPRVVSGNVNVFGRDDGQWEDGPSSGGAIGGGRPTEYPTEEEMAERIPDDVGDGRDDDIVARQIREAAMNEPDPELRERLWEEYRDYRDSIGR